MQTCYKCQQSKPVTDFATDKSKKSGHASICKSCKRQRWFQKEKPLLVSDRHRRDRWKKANADEDMCVDCNLEVRADGSDRCETCLSTVDLPILDNVDSWVNLWRAVNDNEWDGNNFPRRDRCGNSSASSGQLVFCSLLSLGSVSTHSRSISYMR